MKDIYSTFGIYRITNTKNGNSYIGKTAMNFGDRWDCHRAQLRGGYHDNPHLQNAWNKYGEESFEFVVVEEIDDASKLNELEIKYIAKYKADGKSYNISDGGDGGANLGKHLSEETKRKIGEKNRIHMTGKTMSEETRAKMSESQKSRYSNWTQEDREAWGQMISESARGYRWSDESRKNFSKLQQEKPNSAKFTADDIRDIRHKRECGFSLKEIAECYNTSVTYVSNIIHRRRWANI